MPFLLRNVIKILALVVISSLLPYISIANHIYGMDLYYTHVSGNTYTVNLVVYGDCSSSTFSTLPSSSPAINIYNGGTFVSSISLSVQYPTTGLEVTPVCPAQAGHTACVSTTYTIPGVKKFLYSGNVTLPSTSAAWRFVFAGSMGGSYTAGRISSVTNITFTTPPTIELVDTLNNISGPNSSAVYNTIPTPFFCVSQPANYNPAAVDPNGDALSFALVPGVDASTGSSVTYASGYSATSPLSVTSGSFSFSNSTGQLSFTPNTAQKSIVVYNVRETSGGTLKGTSQREMCFIVLSPCTNNPPTGVISAATAGTLVGTTQLNLCSSVDSFSFNINPTDADGDTIDVSAAGLPTGATFNIANNATTAPHCTFRWVAGSATPGTYTFYVTFQDRGCPLSSKQTIAYTVVILPTPTESVVVVSQPTCRHKAVLHITPGGGYSPFFINVLSGSSSVHTFTGVTGTITDSLLPGTYTIRTYNPSFCYKDTTIVLAAPPLPSASISITPPVCNGTSTGIIAASSLDGGSTFTYALNSGAYSSSGYFPSLPSGVDTIHILDTAGCRKDTVVTVPVTPLTLENIFITRPLCHGIATGIVIINAYNSIAPYTYALGSGTYSATDTFSNLAAGIYNFHIKNANGCIVDTTLRLADSLHLHASVSISGVLCYGGNATVTVNGLSGYPAYSYAYNTGAFSSSNIFTVPSGAYTFHVTDTASCTFDTSLSITQPTTLAATFTVHNAPCYGVAGGFVVVRATGGTLGYRYNIDGGSYTTSATITSIAAGSHTLYVKDTNGCIHTDTFSITQPTPVTIDSILLQPPSCYLGTNGIITIYASGGTPGYTYAVNSGTFGMARAIGSLPAGSYTLHIKDANGCIKDTTVNLSQPTPITPSATVTNSLCNTLADGHVSISANGGTPGYTYALGSGAYTASGNFYYIPAGTSVFHIKDANGCIKDTTITITNILHISGIFSITSEPCHGDSTGIITVTGTGGTNPYTYAFGSSSFSSTNTLTGLTAGIYSVHIQDSNGCIGDTTISLGQPNAILAVMTTTPPICYGQSNGSVTISAVGGTASYTYSLNGGPFIYTVAFVGLAGGTDTIYVKDANGCLYDAIITVPQPTQIKVTGISGTSPSCHGGADGTVTVNVTGGTPYYLYSANSAVLQPGNLLTGLAAGHQAIHIKDNHGCLLDTGFTLTEPAALVFSSLGIVSPTCEGYRNGDVTLYGAGGIAPYAYSGDNINYTTNNNFSTLAEGTYTFYIKDAHNCMADTTFALKGYPHIVIDTVNTANPTCAGRNDAVIAVKASGGFPPFVYGINSNTVQFLPGVFNNLHSGTYIITITDSMGCLKDTTITIVEPDTMRLITSVTPNDCFGSDNKGLASVKVEGGSQPYKYQWSLGAGTDSVIIGDADKIYTVRVTDNNYCVDSINVRIGYNDCCIPYIPNAFSPNNDGKNDVFRLRYKGDVRIIEFSVFNRYGERVFTTSYSEDGWDGTYKGEASDMGTYYYYVRLLCGNQHDNIQEFKGNVTLVR